jgi:hypothetical protein
MPRRVPPGKQSPPDAPHDVTPRDSAPVPPPAAGQLDPDLDRDDSSSDPDDADASTPGREERPSVAPVVAVVAAHLGQDQGAAGRVRQYARQMAARHGRVGLIELDATDFRLTCFDATGQPPAGGMNPGDSQGDTGDCYDPRQIAEALEELNWDVRRWLLVLPSPRTPEARYLLRRVGQWVLLSTCDHDGVVSSYRMLKGLTDGAGATGPAGAERPRLSLALLDAADEAERGRVFRKLAGVCEQFLEWTIELEPAPARSSVAPANVAETVVLCCHPTRDKAQIATTPHWPVVADFLSRAKAAPADAASADEPRQPAAAAEDSIEAESAPSAASSQASGDEAAPADGPGMQADVVMPVMRQFPSTIAGTTPPAEQPAPSIEAITTPAPGPGSQPVGSSGVVSSFSFPAAAGAAQPQPGPTISMPISMPNAQNPRQPSDAEVEALEVLDLPSADAPASAILGAVLSRRDGGLVEFPLRPPMCPEARLAVSRDRGVVLLAVTRTGLADLRSIGRAYQWLTENRALIAMAVPQFALDPARQPRLHLLVDHVDATADVLRPMLETDHVTVQAYRRLRWGGKTGLLLEAA